MSGMSTPASTSRGIKRRNSPPPAPTKKVRRHNGTLAANRRRLSLRRRIVRSQHLDDPTPQELGYSCKEAFEHASLRGSMRHYQRMLFDHDVTQTGMPPRPMKTFKHPTNCPFSSDDNSSSGEESDSAIWEAEIPETKRRSGVCKSPPPPPLPPRRQPPPPSPPASNPISLLPSTSQVPPQQLLQHPQEPAAAEVPVAAPGSPEPFPDEDFDVAMARQLGISLEEWMAEGQLIPTPPPHPVLVSQVSLNGEEMMQAAMEELQGMVTTSEASVQVFPGDLACEPTPLIGLPPVTSLTPPLSAAKMKANAARFYLDAGIFPTFQISGGKFISARFSPAVAADPLDIYGCKRFYLHCCKVESFSDPKNTVIPLPVDALRNLLLAVPKIAAHRHSKDKCVQVKSEDGRGLIFENQKLPKPITLQSNVTCEFTKKFGHIVLRFGNGSWNGDPLFRFDFVHRDSGNTIWNHTNFYINLDSMEHIIYNIFPLMREFQTMISAKGEEMRVVWGAGIPEVHQGRTPVNEGERPEVSWEKGIEVIPEFDPAAV